MSYRQNSLILVALAALIITGLAAIAIPAMYRNTPAVPTADVGGTVSFQLTQVGMNEAQSRNATLAAEFQHAIAATATLSAQATLNARSTAAVFPLQTQAALLQTATLEAQRATAQSVAATLAAARTEVSGDSAAIIATATALSAAVIAREAEILEVSKVSIENAEKLAIVASMRGSTGAGNPIQHMAISVDGRWLATVNDSTVTTWELQTGKQLAELRHIGQINDLAFSPDGSLLAVVTNDGSLWGWETEDWRKRYEFKAHADTIFRVAFNPDGAMLATAGGDQTVVWEAATGKPLATLPSGWAWDVKFSPGGRFIITAGGDGNVRLWGVPNR